MTPMQIIIWAVAIALVFALVAAGIEWDGEQ